MDSFYTQTSTIVSSEKSRLILLIVSLLIIFITAFFLYKKYKPISREITLPGPYPLKGMQSEMTADPWKYLLTGDQSAKMMSNNITCGFFIYVDNISSKIGSLTSPEGDYSKLKYVLLLGFTVGIKVDPVHQQIIVDIVEMNKKFEENTPGQVSVLRTIIIKNVVNARWNQIVLSIEGRTVDIYLNGNLVSSTLLDNIPFTSFFGIWLNDSPDFEGQLGLIQIWPERRTAGSIMDNYQRKTDIRGKPNIPDPKLNFSELFRSFCSLTGLCGFNLQPTPLEFIDYEFA